MNIHKKIILLLFIPMLFAFGIHKYYISFTKIHFAPASKSLQVTMKVFTDDLENAINTKFKIESKLGADNEIDTSNDYISKYVLDKFSVHVDENKKNYTFLGKEYDRDQTIIYLEIENTNPVKSIAIKNNMLMEIFSDQQNIIKLSINQKKKSFILTKDNNKDLLKF